LGHPLHPTPLFLYPGQTAAKERDAE